MARDMINPDIATPQWRQLAGILRDRIRSGTYPPGRILPSETQLTQEFDLVRNTIRKAVRLLRDEGLIVTVQGRGSYVADPLPPESDDVTQSPLRDSHNTSDLGKRATWANRAP
jgi:DNA-binding GntR family transcriptional regulator